MVHACLSGLGPQMPVKRRFDPSPKQSNHMRISPSAWRAALALENSSWERFRRVKGIAFMGRKDAAKVAEFCGPTAVMMYGPQPFLALLSKSCWRAAWVRGKTWDSAWKAARLTMTAA